jgi:PAS domain S-box-containing protein
MTNATILVVEDEGIVAMDLQHRLISMGYTVPALAASGQDALKKAAELRPDLVLMDIRLRGGMDGIEVAEQIRDLLDVPPVYITAYTDEDTLRRAKITEPFGYIVKPLDDRTLRSTVEMALYRCKTERQLKQSEAWLRAILRVVGEGVIAADQRRQITLMNPGAEELTGWKQGQALNADLSDVFQVIDAETRTPAENVLTDVCQKYEEVALPKSSLLITRQGAECPVEGMAGPVLDDKGNVRGVVIAFRKGNGSAPATASVPLN